MNLFELLEEKALGKIEVPPSPSIEAQVKAVCQDVLEMKCTVKKSKAKDKMRNHMTVTIGKFLTEADIRSILPGIENIEGIEKVENWSGPEDGETKSTKFNITLK